MSDQVFRRPGSRAYTGLHQSQSAGRQTLRSVRVSREPRSQQLLEAVERLDAHLDPAGRAQLIAWVQDAYRQVGSMPIGLVSKCYLGPPYVDHTLSLLGEIIEHYAPAEPMPEPFQGARMLARNDAYLFVEVYADGLLVPVTDTGQVI